MSNVVLTNQKILFAHYNLTGDLNAVALSATRDALNDTTFGANTKSNLPGLMDVKFSMAGLHNNPAGYETALSSQFGIANKPFSVTASTTAGQTAYFVQAMVGEYTPSKNSVGEILSFSAAGVGTKGTSAPADLIRGQVAYWVENFTTSANGTSINLGAISTQQKLYGAVHVLTVPSTTHSVLPTLQSAASSAASSSQWTTVMSFSTFAAAGSSFQASTGNITDTWFRLSHVTVSSSQSTGVSLVGVFGVL